MIKPQHLCRKLLPGQRHKRILCVECKELWWMGGTDKQRRGPVCKRCVAEAVELHTLMRDLLK